ncbi:hypothetical protein N7495_004522 [Penicillium taxi]|uniref:uncharacterized protein n=1 Tax=Penicillium taxi TaxID=168475 RepID=UPI00254501C6|nr:uncharacterized protein N7495_004522 [Penicillium taxi]KAJ5899778.1 hypothetical protein N7495_004522 [Penicillium taxi]
MRPALLRLLKRPSAVSLLDNLASTSTGIEQLETRYTRLRTDSPWNRHKLLNRSDQIQVNDETEDSYPLELLSVHEIEPSESHVPDLSQRANKPNPENPSNLQIKELRNQFERLNFESDIGHTNDLGTRLVDRPEYKNNFELWEEVLRFRQRYYGNKGTAEIWKGLTLRVEGVQLPSTGDRAGFLWNSFVELGLEDNTVLQEVVNYAINMANSGVECWPQLHESIVGGLLDRGLKEEAIEQHRKLMKADLILPDGMVRILRPAIWPAYLNGKKRQLCPGRSLFFPTTLLRTVRDLCRFNYYYLSGDSSNRRPRIYAQVIKMTLEQGWGGEAFFMHKFLIKYDDHPLKIEQVLPLLRHIRKYGSRMEYHELQRYVERRFPRPSRTKPLRAAKEPSKRDLGARLFATRALSFELAIGGLKMLRVYSIGPESLREMALRAHGGQDILNKLKLLEESCISIEDCVFSRLVRKLAAQRRELLLSDLLKSDQHPDVLEDWKMQESLLISYYLAQDWPQYNIALAALTELFPRAPDLFDIHFRKHIAAGELQAAFKVVDELTLRGWGLSAYSVDYMAEYILTPRRPRNRPPPGIGHAVRDEVMFIFKILQRVVSAGGYVSAKFWIELLRRLGMCHYWDELRECCLWLAHHYTLSTDFNPRPSTVQRDDRILATIFNPGMQKAIIAWGFFLRVTRRGAFKSMISHPTTGENLVPWVRGHLLLHEMEQAGVVISMNSIKRSTRQRMTLLFGNIGHSARRMNRMLRRNNPYQFHQIMQDIDRAWGETLYTRGELDRPQKWLHPYRTKKSLRQSARVKLSLRRG